MPQENEVVQLYLDDIIPNRFQPREIFDEKALKELAVSIKEHGVIQPIIVRNIGNKYEIIAGERRYKASALAGLTKIPAIVRNLDDKESSKVALLENLQRKNLNPIEEARTYQKILELDQMTQEELAKTMGKSQGAVANKLRLLSLPDAVQDAVLKEQISERHARALLNISDQEVQKQMLKRIISEKMTVRELEKELNPGQVPTEENENNVQDMLENIPDQASPVEPFKAPTNPDAAAIVDYSTPPKFIDYGLEEEQEEPADEGGSNAVMTPDIDALRQNAQDIHVEAPTANLDSLLQVEQQQTPAQEQPQESFKFINPNPNLGLEAEHPSQNHTMSDDYFKVPDVVTSPQNNLIPPADPFQIPLIPNQPEAKETEPTPKEPSPQEPAQPKQMNLQTSIETIRDAVKQLEDAGVQVEKDELDFDKNYQIIIRLIKSSEEK